MSEVVQTVVEDGVALITLDNPPVNALGAAVRQGLMAAIEAAEANTAVRAIVIRAAGRTFPAGADIREFGKPPVLPGLGTVCDRIEACAKPVIAALHGTALGGGLELALAAHYRVALASTMVGLPEVTLGILPGAGGTQRLPRLTGAKEALRIMLTGAPVGAAEALALGILDLVVEQDLDAAALEMARSDLPPRPVLARTEAMRDPAGWQAAVHAARARLVRTPVMGPARIVDCVEAALLLPSASGLLFERAAFEDCVGTDAAAGLRHVFFAERRAARIPETAVPRPVGMVGVVGGDAAAISLVGGVIAAGLRAMIVAPDRAALIRALQAIATAQERLVEHGDLTAEARDADWARLSGSIDPGALADADMVIVSGDAAEVARVAAALPPGVVLASAHGAAEGAIGFSSAGSRLVEVSTGHAAPDAIATGFAVAKRLGRIAVRVGGDHGLISARLWLALRLAGDWLVAHGASPGQVDAAVCGLGFAAGPFGSAGDAGTGPVKRSEIEQRCMAAMVSAALRMLGDGTALRPSDIDLVSVLGMGLARWQGGVLKLADARGLLMLRRDLLEYGAADRAIWGRHPLLLDLIKNGRTFADLNEG